MKIRIMILGLGAMGLGIAELLRKFPDFEIVAIADKNPAALERAKMLIQKKTLVTLNPENALKTKPDVLIDATTSILESALLLSRAMEQKTRQQRRKIILQLSRFTYLLLSSERKQFCTDSTNLH